MPPSLVVLSPHRDDAAFSTGALLLQASSAALPLTILNVFTISSYAPFGDPGLSTEAVTRLRLEEDQAALALLGPTITLHDLAHLDAPLRLEIRDDQVVSGPLSLERLAQQVSGARAALPDLSTASMLLVPLALGAHIDHIIARDAGMSAVSSDRIGFYQDLPYASRMHSVEALELETAQILEKLGSRLNISLDPYLLRSPADVCRQKQRLVACYPSQIARETMDEIADWTLAMGGERLYFSPAAANHLQAFLAQTSLSITPQHSSSRP